MGSGLCYARMPSGKAHNDIIGVHPDTTNIYAWKLKDLKSILKSDRATSALLKNLEKNDKDCILLYYLDIIQCKNIRQEQLLSKVQEIKSKYDPNVTKFQKSTTLNDVWSSINKTFLFHDNLDDQKLNDNLNLAESFCLLQMSNELQDILNNRDLVSKFETDNYCRLKKPLDRELVEKYKNILIINDCPVISQLMTYILEINGHHVRQANHGRVGVHIATLNHFDVIFVDLSMTTMNPAEVIQLIKSSSTTSSEQGTVHTEPNRNKKPFMISRSVSSLLLQCQEAFQTDTNPSSTTTSTSNKKSNYNQSIISKLSEWQNNYIHSTPSSSSTLIIGSGYNLYDMRTADIDHFIPLCPPQSHPAFTLSSQKKITKKSLKDVSITFNNILIHQNDSEEGISII
jgi:CheY-like chemotaxis protein